MAGRCGTNPKAGPARTISMIARALPSVLPSILPCPVLRTVMIRSIGSLLSARGIPVSPRGRSALFWDWVNGEKLDFCCHSHGFNRHVDLGERTSCTGGGRHGPLGLCCQSSARPTGAWASGQQGIRLARIFPRRRQANFSCEGEGPCFDGVLFHKHKDAEQQQGEARELRIEDGKLQWQEAEETQPPPRAEGIVELKSPTCQQAHIESPAPTQFELEGKLKAKFDIQVFPSGFSKREFVITTNEMYPQDVKFELIKDKCVGPDAIMASRISSLPCTTTQMQQPRQKETAPLFPVRAVQLL